MLKKILVLKIITLLVTIISGDETNVSVENIATNTTQTNDTKALNDTETEELSVSHLLGDQRYDLLLQLKEHLNLTSPDSESLEKKKQNLKQVNDKHITTRVLLHQAIDGIYNCTTDSMLSVVNLHSEYDNHFVCNQVLDMPLDTKLVATLRMIRSQPIPLSLNASTAQMVYFKGNQLYYAKAKVESGYCKGDKIRILNVSLVKRGSCNTRSGVTTILSEFALLVVSGRCRSTCFGDVNVNLKPGIRD